MTLQGTVSNGRIVLDKPAPWPEGTRVEVDVKPVSQRQGASKLGARLLKHGGAISNLPPDMAAQHDHYIHKTPKR